MKAFQDALNAKTYYEGLKEKLLLKQKEEKLDLQKFLAGKTTIKSVFQSGSKEDRIKGAEANIAEVIKFLNKILRKEKIGKELESVQFLCDIVTVILGYVEIDRFKVPKKKLNSYFFFSFLNYFFGDF